MGDTNAVGLSYLTTGGGRFSSLTSVEGDMSTTHTRGELGRIGVCSWKSRARRRCCLTRLRTRLMTGVLPDMGISAMTHDLLMSCLASSVGIKASP